MKEGAPKARSEKRQATEIVGNRTIVAALAGSGDIWGA